MEDNQTTVTTGATAEAGTETQATAVNVEEITRAAEQKATEAAEKKAAAVFKSMLEQQGLDEQAIKDLLASRKTTATETKQPEVSPEVKALQEQMAALMAATAEKDAKLAETSELETLKTLKVPQEQQRFYRFEIGEMAKAEGIPFADAASKYIESNPPFIVPPSFAKGQANPSVNQTEKDKILAEAKRLMGIN